MSEAQRPPIWFTAPELPGDVFAVWHKPERAISPVAIVATVDEDGAPRTAPCGSLRAVAPRLLRLCSWHDHDTYANLCRDGRVSVALISPELSVSVQGRARLVRERMQHDEDFAALEIDVDKVKNGRDGSQNTMMYSMPRAMNRIPPIHSQRQAMSNMKTTMIVGIRCIGGARTVSQKP
jgi:hypothetical protein